jgi:hypothetical protein
MVGDTRQGWTVLAAMTAIFVVLLGVCYVAEQGGAVFSLLTISKTDDIIAVLALAGCGLIAGAFGQRRERLSEAAGRADRELAILSRLVERA